MKDDVRGIVDDALGPDPLAEDLLAQRFAVHQQQRLRYLNIKGTWFEWSGGRWHAETTLLAFDLARDNNRTAAQEFGNGKAPRSVLSAKSVAAVEHLARADRRIATTIEQWDADDFTFNNSEPH